MNIDVPGVLIEETDEKQLKDEFNLLYLLFHRNKNQFHLLNWFQSLHQLLTYTKKLILLIDKYNYRRIITRTKFEVLQKVKSKRIYYDKQKFHLLELRFKKLSSFILNKLVPVCYQKFMQILSLGQFITLGFALIAILAKVRCICGKYVSEKRPQITDTSEATIRPEGENSKNDDAYGNNEDIGELYSLVEEKFSERTVLSTQIGCNESTNSSSTKLNMRQPPKTNVDNKNIFSRSDTTVVQMKTIDKASKKEKKKKKKSKNYFDDLFG